MQLQARGLWQPPYSPIVKAAPDNDCTFGFIFTKKYNDFTYCLYFLVNVFLKLAKSLGLFLAWKLKVSFEQKKDLLISRIIF